jgi:hypothetical protein
MPDDDGQVGGPIDDGWPRRTMPAKGARAVEDGWAAVGGRRRLEARGRPWTDGGPRADDAVWRRAGDRGRTGGRRRLVGGGARDSGGC